MILTVRRPQQRFSLVSVHEGLRHQAIRPLQVQECHRLVQLQFLTRPRPEAQQVIQSGAGVLTQVFVEQFQD